MSEPTSPTAPEPADDQVARHRSGAVARMVRMPVATLRVWERRYRVTGPVLTPSGQRLYSAAQVRRLMLIKSLTERGHAIGSLAALDERQLRAIADADPVDSPMVRTEVSERALTVDDASVWRVAVIGQGWEDRLGQPGLRRALGRQPMIVAAADDAPQAAMLDPTAFDALLAAVPRLHHDWLPGLRAAAPSLVAVPTAVLYAFAPESACRDLADAGVAVLREPQTDTALGQWLRHWSAGRPATRPPARSAGTSGAPGADTRDPAPARRWNDTVLARFAAQPQALPCECPRHLADLLLQLSRFEAYSADCEHRHPADAALHAALHRLAGATRVRFEAALAQVAQHEGLALPG